jgi:hypothetical protein
MQINWDLQGSKEGFKDFLCCHLVINFTMPDKGGTQDEHVKDTTA